MAFRLTLIDLVLSGTKKGQAICVAPLQPPTLAAFLPWGIKWELVAQDLPRPQR